MAGTIAGDAELRYDRLSLIPLGGQSELGQALWVLSFGGELLLVDAGAAYPVGDLPGVDLLLPNLNFLESNKDRIQALVLTNGHEGHCGACPYLLDHFKIPRIMAPPFVSALVSQNLMERASDTIIDTIKLRHPYQIGPFQVEWIQVNDAIADACALAITTPEGVIVYTSSFKLDQTPVDNRLMDVARLANIGDRGVTLLIGSSGGVEESGYSQSERAVASHLERLISQAAGRAIVVVSGSNTHRLQILFDLASSLGRKVVLYGESLIHAAVAAVVTGNLIYDRKIEATPSDLERLPDRSVLVVVTGREGDPMEVVDELAFGRHRELTLNTGDTVIYSAEVYPGAHRQIAMILDQFLSKGVKAFYGQRHGIHVSNYAGREELKLMLSLTRPACFVPALGEGRHIMHHAQLAREWGLPSERIFPLKNGEILEISHQSHRIIGSVESQAVLYNRDHGTVTDFSVKERRALSMEGVLTIGLVIGAQGELLSQPKVDGAASAFLLSDEWAAVRMELSAALVETVEQFTYQAGEDHNALKTAVREIAVRTIRQRLSAKPLVQVIVHQVLPAAGN